MAMSSATLSTAMRAALLAADCGVTDCEALTGMCDAIAQTVVAHIAANAVVTVAFPIAVQVAVPSGTGATTAPGTGTVA